MTIHKIGIIGAGRIGAGIAQAASFWGKQVVLLDDDRRNLDGGMDRIGSIYQGWVEKGKLSPEQIQSRQNLIIPTQDWEYFAGVDLIIEAVPEDIDIKAFVLQKAIQFCPANAILASHNSTLSIRELGRKISRPEMLVGVHFNYPAHEMVLVEIAHCGLTDRRIIDDVAVFIGSMDKIPVVVKDGVGYLQNRQLLPYLLEATLALEEGQKTLQEIDEAMVELGLYMGPFKQIDLIGIDVCIALARRMMDSTGDQLPKLWTGLEKAGCLGIKTGAGFYDYKEEKPVVNPLVDELNKIQNANNGEFSTNRLLLPMINEAARILEEGVADAYDIDVAIKVGTGMRIDKKFTGALEAADTFGLPFVVGELEMMQNRYRDRFKPAGIFSDLIERGRIGLAANAGFFEYAPDYARASSTGAGAKDENAFRYIRVDVRDSIAIAALNHSLSNKIDDQVLRELSEAVDTLNADCSVKAVIVTGTGNFAFSSGLDNGMIKAAIKDDRIREQLVTLGRETLNKIQTSSKPYIAAINGSCTGAGLELALACHFRVAAQSIRLGQNEIGMGSIPVWGAAGRLQRIVGPSRAARMILSGSLVSAQLAAEWGLVDELAADGYVIDRSVNLAREMTDKSAVALQAALYVLNGLDKGCLSSEWETTDTLFRRVLAGQDIKEGITAMKEERSPFFQ
ncbi:MAG: enoyl-CoA hydratase/isomerase family protein [Anaerolineales bacterium]|nr:enoyl-CoA hydratase/isomerase family protein [Anaerolineales bacterium]